MAQMIDSIVVQVEYVDDPLRITSMALMVELSGTGTIVYPPGEEPPIQPPPIFEPPEEPGIPVAPVINMRGGFTFKGIHSSVFGVRQTPSSRVLSPLKRRDLIRVPGRSKAVVEQDGGYEPRVEGIICSYGKQHGVNIHEQVRQIAGWLDGIGELTFDYEPTLHYVAFVSSPPPTVTVLDGAQFQIEFTINHPFAYETTQQQAELIAAYAPDNKMEIEVGGTVETPARIVIKNNTNHTMTSLKIYHIYLEGVGS